jgi:hypothetical protein
MGEGRRNKAEGMEKENKEKKEHNNCVGKMYGCWVRWLE